MVLEFKYRIEFTGIHRGKAAKTLARYFNADVSVKDDVYTVTDSMDREWIFSHSEYVRPEGLSEGEDEVYYQTVLETPMIYFPRDDDWLLMHDVLNILRCVGAVVNDSCAMHIRTPFSFDHSMMGLMLSFYSEIQYDQFNEFDIVSKSVRNRAKPFTLHIDNNGLDFDGYNEILDYIEFTYGRLADPLYVAVENFALNFLPYMTDKTVEFRAFNASFDDEYVAKASSFVRGVIVQCLQYYQIGWKQIYDFVRTDAFQSASKSVRGFLICR